MMWFLLLLCFAHAELAFSQDTRLILKNDEKGNPCEGHVEIHSNGTWGLVGDTLWNEKTEEVVCRSAHCGEPVSSQDVIQHSDSSTWLNEMNCSGSEEHLWDCSNPGWNISYYSKDSHKKISCSYNIKIDLDGFQCAGAVRYSINTNTRGYFCANNWGEEEADLVCETLGCGAHKDIPSVDWMVWNEFSSSQKMTIDCSGIGDLNNLWQCATQASQSCSKPASVICQGHERLRLKGDTKNACEGQLEIEEENNWIPFKTSNKTSPNEWCQHMYCGKSVSHQQNDNGTLLTCSDTVEVLLKDNNAPSKCFGAVHVSVNGESHSVCGADWTQENAKMVCKELNCGNVASSVKVEGFDHSGIMDHVNCLGDESSLWHCKAKRDSQPFSCQYYAYIVCTDSVDARIVDGPGKCAGRVEIKYEGAWHRVRDGEWTGQNTNAVCQQRKCGKKGQVVTSGFSQGSGAFLPKAVSCLANAAHIKECSWEDSKRNSGTEVKSVAVICDNHKVLFLSSSCSGKVGIQSGKKTYWLSGSEETWNNMSANAVCQQMHCGTAREFHAITNTTDMMVWKRSYNCSSDSTSLFDCLITKTPSDYNQTIAYVSCSGNVRVNLTENCWGNVNVCIGDECGGVCKDSWTEDMSTSLCKSQNCGDERTSSNNPPEKIKVLFSSLHPTNDKRNLNQCNLVKKDTEGPTCKPASVVCSGSIKSRIRADNSTYRCSGNVEVYYEGQWLPVCANALKDINTQNAICEEQSCGSGLRTIDYFGAAPSEAHYITGIKCTAGNKHSEECEITPGQGDCTPGGLQCSRWSKMELKFNAACSGKVFAHSEGSKQAVSTEGWTETDSVRLCQGLQCGNLKSNTSVKQLLTIECQDEPSVTLSETCGGEVKINNISVSSSNWKESYSHLVCQEQGCSNAILTYDKQPRTGQMCYHVDCEKYHHKLGQCRRFYGKCTGKLVSVSCVDRVTFNTTEKCGGQIQVNYRNKWEKMCAHEFRDDMKNKLCQHLGCGDSRKKSVTSTKSRIRMETRLNCSSQHKDLRHCIRAAPCQTQPLEIYCEKYQTKPPEEDGSNVAVIVGVSFLVLLLIVIAVSVRFYLVRRARNARNKSSRMMPRNVELESGEYEDVTDKESELEDFNRSMLQSRAEGMMERDARSTSSYPYDDIDEAVEAKPLRSQTPPAGASESQSDFRNPGPEQSSGKF
ncbi:uncharacterized protein V6R79_000555 [Siganus canaliculatus]